MYIYELIHKPIMVKNRTIKEKLLKVSESKCFQLVRVAGFLPSTSSIVDCIIFMLKSHICML